MSRFKSMQFNVQAEPKGASEFKIVRLEGAQENTIKPYEMQPLAKSKAFDLNEIQTKLGKAQKPGVKPSTIIKSTDPKKPNTKNLKDQRFTLNPLLRERLSIEEEEQKHVLEQVQAELAKRSESVLEAARKDGFQAGFEKGRAEALERFQAEGHEKLGQFESLIQEFEQAKTEILAANERYLLSLMIRCAKMVALREIKTDPEYLLRLSRTLIERISFRENIRVQIHPSEIACASDLRHGVEEMFDGLKNLRVEASDQVRSGGCILETDWNITDASVETQIENLLTGVLGEPTEVGDLEKKAPVEGSGGSVEPGPGPSASGETE